MEEVNIDMYRDMDDFESTTYPIKPNYIVRYKICSVIPDVMKDYAIENIRNYIEDFVDVPVGVRYFVYKNREDVISILVNIVLHEDYKKFLNNYKDQFRQFGEFTFKRVFSGSIRKDKSQYKFFKGSEVVMIIDKALRYENFEISKKIERTWYMKVESVRYTIFDKAIKFYITIRVLYNGNTIFLRTFTASLAHNEKMQVSSAYKTALAYIQIRLTDILYLKRDELENTYSLEAYKEYRYDMNAKITRVVEYDIRRMEEENRVQNTVAKFVYHDLESMRNIKEAGDIRRNFEDIGLGDIYGPYIEAVDLINKTDLKN